MYRQRRRRRRRHLLLQQQQQNYLNTKFLQQINGKIKKEIIISFHSFFCFHFFYQSTTTD